MIHGLNKETLFVVESACTGPGSRQKSRIVDAASHVKDWQMVYDISQTQRVLPLVFENIKNLLSDSVPEVIQNQFKDANFDIASRCLYFESFLFKLTALLDEHEIRVLPFKGPVMAQDIYQNSGIRFYSDLDILVDQQDAVRTWSILMENGLLPELNLSRKQFVVFIKNEDNFSFSANNETIVVELHWEMSGFYLSNPLRLHHIEKNLKKTQFNGKVVDTLSPEDLIVYLCIHGCKHGWSHLDHVCGIAQVLQSKKIQWERVHEKTIRFKCKKMVGLGLYLAREILNADIPETVSNDIDSDKTIPMLALQATAFMFGEDMGIEAKKISSRFSIFHIHIRDNFKEKIIYFLRLIFSPTKMDWFQFPFPAGLSFLHHIFRPVRLAFSKLKKSDNGVDLDAQKDQQ